MTFQPVSPPFVGGTHVEVASRLETMRQNQEHLHDTAPELIGAGAFSGLELSIPVPVGEFPQLQLVLRGQLDAVGIVGLRINNHGAAGSYRTGYIVNRASDGAVADAFHSDDTIRWRLAEWATVSRNHALVDIFSTDVSSPVSYDAYGARHSATASVHRRSTAWGRMNTSLLTSSLTVRTVGGQEFTSLFWRLRGFR